MSKTFKERGWKPETPFTEEQVSYLEDILTSAIMAIELERHDLERLKLKLGRDLDEIRSMKHAAKSTDR